MCDANLDRSLIGHFSPLEDQRCPINRRHVLIEMVVIAIAAVMCGADGWVAVAQFGRSKEAWLREFLALPKGIPSHDTFGRVFSLLQPEAFEDCFRSWVASIPEVIPGEIIAIDGKTLRRSHDRTAGLAALHLVSAWAASNRVVLGQVATEAKSNEITAIPQLLAVLRHIALTRLKKDNTKLGIKNKRLKAGWDERYLAKLLFQSPFSTEKTTLSGSPNIRSD